MPDTKKKSVGQRYYNMSKYDYERQIKNDLVMFFKENFSPEWLENDLDTTSQDFVDIMYDAAMNCDSVTGNASGSYFCNAGRAHEAIFGNEYIYEEAIKEYGYDSDKLAEEMFNYEFIDVVIRCYLLADCLHEFCDKIEELLISYKDDKIYCSVTLNDYLIPRLEKEFTIE